MIYLTFPGRPVPWARVKRGRNGHAYTPPKQAEHRERLAWAIKEAAEGQELRGPVCVDAVFDYGKKETRLKIYGRGEKDTHYRDKIPDVDNLLKAVLDALQDSGVVENDKQVAYVRAEKVT